MHCLFLYLCNVKQQEIRKKVLLAMTLPTLINPWWRAFLLFGLLQWCLASSPFLLPPWSFFLLRFHSPAITLAIQHPSFHWRRLVLHLQTSHCVLQSAVPQVCETTAKLDRASFCWLVAGHCVVTWFAYDCDVGWKAGYAITTPCCNVVMSFLEEL